MTRHRITTVLVVVALSWSAAGAGEMLMVACAPGYPGTTDQAQPAMNDLAAGIEKQVGWKPGTLAAVYHEKESGGLEALAAAPAVLALVPLPFYLEHREELDLEPILEVIQTSGEPNGWTLVARRGAISGPADLRAWTIDSLAGYSPRFITGVALGGWGRLPAETRVEFTPRVLSALRKSAAGETVAVLLDGAQAEALPSLPFAADLEVVARSRQMPGDLLCAVGGRLPEDAAATLLRLLPAMSEDDEGHELLESVRISEFRALDAEALASLERAFSAGSDGGK
jgi:hypothetical protein